MRPLLLWLAFGMYVPTEPAYVPLSRLTRNLEKRLAAAPDDGWLHLALGRVYGQAWASGGDKVKSFVVPRGKSDAVENAIASVHGQLYAQLPFERERGVRPNDEHLAKAIEHHRRAMTLLEGLPEAKLGLAYLLVQQPDTKAEGITLLREIVATHWPKEQGSPGVGGFTFEAAGYLADALDPMKDEKEIADLAAKSQVLLERDMGHQIITPIAIPLAGATHPSEVLDRNARVRFDLDGRGRDLAWQWLQDAAWLVWDPRGTACITSGQQLFGSLTFFVHWRDGYAALASLDDDGDGWLTGDELMGLALWHDRNTDGVSDAGEVWPARGEIAAIATSASGQTAEGPMHERGVHMLDGSVRPSFDLVLAPR